MAAEWIMRARASHDEHVRAGQPGKCCMYCQVAGLILSPADGGRWNPDAG